MAGNSLLGTSSKASILNLSTLGSNYFLVSDGEGVMGLLSIILFKKHIVCISQVNSLVKGERFI